MSKVEKIYENENVSEKPVYALLPPKYSGDSIHGKSQIKHCYCSCCEKVSEIPAIPLDNSVIKDLENNRVYGRYFSIINNIRDAVNEIECPECHSKSHISFLPFNSDMDVYAVPVYAKSLTGERHVNDDGTVDSLHYKLTMSSPVIRMDNKDNPQLTIDKHVMTEIIDFNDKTHIVTNNIEADDVEKNETRKLFYANNTLDCYQYRVSSKSAVGRKFKENLSTPVTVTQLSGLVSGQNTSIIAFGGFFHDNSAIGYSGRREPVLKTARKADEDTLLAIKKENKIDSYNSGEYSKGVIVFDRLDMNPNVAKHYKLQYHINTSAIMLNSNNVTSHHHHSNALSTIKENEMMNRQKRDEIAKSLVKNGVFDKINPRNLDLYLDFVKNKTCIVEKSNTAAANEDNTVVDNNSLIRMTNLMIRYPAAFELACKMADAEIENEAFKKIKDETDPEVLKNMSKEDRHAAIDRMLTSTEMTKRVEIKKGQFHEYTVKDSPISDVKKSLIFRDKIAYIETQLALVDDNILDTINKCKNLDELMPYLRYYVGGPQSDNTVKMFGGESKMPDHIAASLKHNASEIDNEEYNEPVCKAAMLTKGLMKRFNEDPIGVANTIRQYSKIAPLHKDAKKADIDVHTQAISMLMAYTDPNYTKTVNPPKNQPDAKPYTVTNSKISHKSINNASSSLNGADADKCPTKAGTIRAINKGTAISFFKAYAESKTPTSLVDSLYNPDPAIRVDDNLLNETVKLYSNFTKNSSVKIIKNKEDFEMDIRKIDKENLRTYLLNGHTLKDAYVDFIFVRDLTMEETLANSETRDSVDVKDIRRTTKDVNVYINQLAREIRNDSQMNAVSNYFTENGVDSLIEKIKSGEDDLFKGYGKYIEHLDYYNPEAKNSHEKLAEIITRNITEHKEKAEKETNNIAAWGRDKKPIFDRSLKQLHDELGHLVNKKMIKRQPINYNEEELELEAEYTYGEPNEKGEKSKLKFVLFKDTTTFIRVAQDLSNCIGGSHYVNDGVTKRKYFLYLEDEIGKKVAAVELYPKGRDYETGKLKFDCGQFEAAHDMSLPAAYAPTAHKWMKEHNICSDHSHDVALFGSGRPVYGDGNADFHTEEIDDVTNRVVSKNENKSIAVIRETYAGHAYGRDADNKVMVPDVPADLENFNNNDDIVNLEL